MNNEIAVLVKEIFIMFLRLTFGAVRTFIFFIGIVLYRNSR
jgi:hypothetical protein